MSPFVILIATFISTLQTVQLESAQEHVSSSPTRSCEHIRLEREMNYKEQTDYCSSRGQRLPELTDENRALDLWSEVAPILSENTSILLGTMMTSKQWLAPSGEMVDQLYINYLVDLLDLVNTPRCLSLNLLQSPRTVRRVDCWEKFATVMCCTPRGPSALHRLYRILLTQAPLICSVAVSIVLFIMCMVLLYLNRSYQRKLSSPSLGSIGHHYESDDSLIIAIAERLAMNDQRMQDERTGSTDLHDSEH